MKKFIFTVVTPEIDCDYLNESNLDFQFMSPFGPNDSGFCDAVTGQQIIGPGDRFSVVINTNEELGKLLKCNSKQLMCVV